jgi:hypothetical protein
LYTGRFRLIDQRTILTQHQPKLPRWLGRAHAGEQIHEAHFGAPHLATRIQIDDTHGEPETPAPLIRPPEILRERGKNHLGELLALIEGLIGIVGLHGLHQPDQADVGPFVFD